MVNSGSRIAISRDDTLTPTKEKLEFWAWFYPMLWHVVNSGSRIAVSSDFTLSFTKEKFDSWTWIYHLSFHIIQFLTICHGPMSGLVWFVKVWPFSVCFYHRVLKWSLFLGFNLTRYWRLVRAIFSKIDIVLKYGKNM